MIVGFAFLVAGPALGWFAAVWRMQRREEELEERERRVRLKALELQRSIFQDSTTKIHSSQDLTTEETPPAEPDEHLELMTSVREQLAQAEMERESLEQAHQLEIRSLQDELYDLREEISRLRDTPATFEDVPSDEDIESVDTVVEPDDPFDFHWTGPLPEPVRSRPEPVNPPPTEPLPVPPVPPAPQSPAEPTPPRRPIPQRPAFKPVSDLVDTENGSTGSPPLQRLLKMNAEQYALLEEIGYATVDRIASLTPIAVERLSGIFGVSESEIRDHWVPDAQKAVFSPDFN